MKDTIVTWNWPNWITVGLMSFLFLGVLGLGIQLYTRSRGVANDNTGTAYSKAA